MQTAMPLNKGLIWAVTACLFAGLFLPSAAIRAGTPNYVNPKQVYTYDVMVGDMKELAKAYSDIMSYRSIGKSEYGRDIWELRVGRGPVKILLNGSHHAREWITTITLMEMAESMGQNVRSGAVWNGRSISDLLDHVTFHFVPMVNPDGVTLQQKGAGAFPKKIRPALLLMNKGSSNFKRWKANAKGIDLNRQYPSGWNTIRNPAAGPSYMNFKGKKPLQAKEAAAMAAFTRELKPDLAVSYHSSGEIVYWNYKTPAAQLERDRKIAAAYSSLTGYKLAKPEKNPSGGGFTDWVITEFKKPALTPELGRPAGETHVPLSAWDRVWKQQKNAPWLLGDAVLTLWQQGQKEQKAEGDVELQAKADFYRSPELAGGRAGTLANGIYPVLRTRGSWTEIRAGGESLWVASVKVRPAAKERKKKEPPEASQPSQTPKPAEPAGPEA